MMSGSIPGIHSQGNQYYPTLPSSFSLSPCHTSILLQQAEPVFFPLDFWYLLAMRPHGLLAHHRCDARGAFRSPCLEAETLLLLSGIGEEWTTERKGHCVPLSTLLLVRDGMLA
jgi:hypothetical protein